jgi:heterogeneous nuclear rnp K-like protein 2
MSASPVPATAPSQKRPLEEPSSPNGPTDQPDAKRPALDKIKDEESVHDAAPASPDVKAEVESEVKSEVEPSGPAAATVEAALNEDPAESHGDTVVLDAPPAGMPSATQVLETQPVQSTAANGASAGGQDQYSAQQQDESNWLHIRAIISSAEAATVIGKGGENVTQIRRMSGAKCTVSDYSRGAVERVLTVSGLVDAVAKVLFDSCCIL